MSNNSVERNLFYGGMKQFSFQFNGTICGTELHFCHQNYNNDTNNNNNVTTMPLVES